VAYLDRCFCGLLLLVSLPGLANDYGFDGKVSEEVLRSYLSRSMTVLDLVTGVGDLDDNIRMLKNCGVKFAGRTIYLWGQEADLPRRLESARKAVPRVHDADPEIILQACVFEIVSQNVENLPVPDWAFKAVGRPVEKRNFQYEAMVYPSGRGRDQWGKGASVPDVSRAETRLWFYYLAASYLDAGCEAIHFGQAEIMNGNDRDLRHWAEVLDLVRQYAAKHARRHWVLCDAHVPSGGLVREGKLLLDFHSFPLRIAEVVERPQEGELRVGFVDSIYGRSKGGISPSGWGCDHLPYLVELDNWGASSKPGQPRMGGCWVWGYDEITWFAQQPEAYRNEWLRYAWRWVREHDPAGYLEMPGSRCLTGAANGKGWYYVNRPSAVMPAGFGQEEAIREIWARESTRKRSAADVAVSRIAVFCVDKARSGPFYYK
jgi:hypothetical protein